MTKRILIVVETEEAADTMVDMIGMLVHESIVERIERGKHRHVLLKTGDEYTVWSVKNWTECTTCGAHFDAVMYLVDPPKYVVQSLRTCITTTGTGENQ